jgi:hypothetical protein
MSWDAQVLCADFPSFPATASPDQFKTEIGNYQSDDPEPRLNQHLSADEIQREARPKVHFEKN